MNREAHPLNLHIKASGESLTGFAARIGMSRMQLYRIMDGEGTTTDTLKKISDATDGAVPPSAFFEEDKAKPKKRRSTEREGV